jgi:hypothetical protein
MIWRCHGIHTSGMVERARAARRSSGATSFSRTRVRASSTISVHGVSMSSRRTRLSKTSSNSMV